MRGIPMSTEDSLLDLSDEKFREISRELDKRLSNLLRDAAAEFNVNGIELVTIALTLIAEAMSRAFKTSMGVDVNILSMVNHVVEQRTRADT